MQDSIMAGQGLARHVSSLIHIDLQSRLAHIMNVFLLIGLLAATVCAAALLARIIRRVRAVSARVAYTIATITAAGGGGVVSEWTGLTNITQFADMG